MSDTSTLTPEFLRIAKDIASVQGVDPGKYEKILKNYAENPCAHCLNATWMLYTEVIEDISKPKPGGGFEKKESTKFNVVHCTLNLLEYKFKDCSRSKSPHAAESGRGWESVPARGAEERERERPRG